MKAPTLAVVLLAVCLLAIPATSQKTKEMLVQEATQKAQLDVKKVANTIKAVGSAADVTVKVKLQKDLKEKKAALTDARKKIADKIDLALAKRMITRLEDRINRLKTSPKPDLARIDKLTKRREWWISRQEQVRIEEEKRLKIKVQGIKKDEKKIEERVKYCRLHPKTKGCRYFLNKYAKDVRIVKSAEQQEKKIEGKIAKSREQHIKTFKNNANIDAKKAIIDNRYNSIIARIKRRIARLEKQLKKLQGRHESKRDKNAEIRIQKRIEKLRNHLKKLELEKEKTQVIRSTGPGDCNSCEQKILELLNKMYTMMLNDHARIPQPQVNPAVQPNLKPLWNDDDWEHITKYRNVEKVRSVRKPHSWTTKGKRIIKKKVRKGVRVQKPVFYNRTEYVVKPKVWYSQEKKKETHYKLADDKKVETKRREVVKKVPFEDTKWVDEKVLVNKPSKKRLQELVQLPDGKFDWRDIGYENKTVPVWETQRKQVKFTNYREVKVSEPYQVTSSGKKRVPYTVEIVKRKKHLAYEKVPVRKTYKKIEWVTVPKDVEEEVPEEFTQTHHGHRDAQEKYTDRENYNERVRRNKKQAKL